MKYVVVMAIMMAVLSGCTKQAWYEGMRTGHANECGRLEGEAREKCLKNNDMSYEKYEELRK